MFKLTPILASGSTVVFKPSPETTVDSYLLAEAAIEAGLSAGVLNIVPGGAETGKTLVGHPGGRQGRLHRLDPGGATDRRGVR